MKKMIFPFTLSVLVSIILSSCYAFMKADKLIYTGTIAKKPTEIVVDSSYSATVIVEKDNK